MRREEIGHARLGEKRAQELRHGTRDEAKHAEAIHADLAVRAATQYIRARAIGEKREPGGTTRRGHKRGGGGVAHHGERVGIGRVHVRALRVAVHEQHLLAGGCGKLSSRKKSIRVTAAGEAEVECGDVLWQAERMLKTNCERGEPVGMRERDGDHATHFRRLHARQRAPCRREGKVEHALSLGGHAARGETGRLHDALGLRASDEVGEDGEIVGRARGYAAEDRLNGQCGQFDHGGLKARRCAACRNSRSVRFGSPRRRSRGARDPQRACRPP